MYLDCASTTPLDPRVEEAVLRYLRDEFGNAGSRTHDYGQRARRAVEHARDQVAAVAGASRAEVVFTSGATESNNIAILGLAEHGRRNGRTHVVSTEIEHHAVLEPLHELSRRGFELTLVPPSGGGRVDPQQVRAAVRDDTLLVSVMHVNNETGSIQPIAEIAALLGSHLAFLHVDAAQGFGKDIEPLANPRIDFTSISGHKINAPKGVGALIVRRRAGERPPLTPLMFGGGQERGLRPGTIPVHLVVGLGLAAELAMQENAQRLACARAFRQRLLDGLAPLHPVVNGDLSGSLPFILNVSIPGTDAESVMEAWKDLAAVSNGAACTSQLYTCSHVLSAMRLNAEQMDAAVRISWSHLTPMPDLDRMVSAALQLRL